MPLFKLMMIICVGFLLSLSGQQNNNFADAWLPPIINFSPEAIKGIENWANKPEPWTHFINLQRGPNGHYR